ncbi:MAG: capsule assembly Wzi family protein [Acidobacteriaceae bacterium]
MRFTSFPCSLLALCLFATPPLLAQGENDQPAPAGAPAATQQTPGEPGTQTGQPTPPPAPAPPVQFTRTIPVPPVRYSGSLGSTYIPLDSWMYPEIMRLYSLGFIDTVFLGMRPYTRTSVAHMLDASAGEIYNSDSDEAKDIYSALSRELAPDLEIPVDAHRGHSEIESVYTRMLGITGPPLRDPYHAGQTIVNDYGRPYAEGFNSITGLSVRTTLGRYSGYFRGEYQHAPTLWGYSTAVASQLSFQDEVFPLTYYNPTLPYGATLQGVDTFRIQEAYLAANFASHEISIGKSDEWYGPGRGGGMGYSNNAENIYSIRINRVEPAYIPFVSRFLGPIRYDFLYGSLQGHTAYNSPYTHSEGFSFKPTSNFEFGFERTIVFGGKGHEPVTWHTFLKGFFDINDTTEPEKIGRNDPGARFSAFNFSYRVPFVRNWLTFYSDSEAHDDVTPISAPRRAAMRPGIYLSHFPGAPKLSWRVEAVSTDPPTGRSIHGSFMYWEAEQRQAYTNKGFTFGDWIGREAKGGQSWLTYHLSGNEWVEFQYRNVKSAKDFIPMGTTQNDFTVSAVKRLGKDVEVNGWVQYERWKAPFLLNGNTAAQNDTSIAVQLTFYPRNSIRRY